MGTKKGAGGGRDLSDQTRRERQKKNVESIPKNELMMEE